MISRSLLLATVALLGLDVAAARAAAPTYCALYARQYALQNVQDVAAVGMRQSIEDQAYFRCLNADEDPPLPGAGAVASVDAGRSESVAEPRSEPTKTAERSTPASQATPAANALAYVDADRSQSLPTSTSTSPTSAALSDPVSPAVPATEVVPTPRSRPASTAAQPGPVLATIGSFFAALRPEPTSIEATPPPAGSAAAPPAPAAAPTGSVQAAAGPAASPAANASSGYKGSGLQPGTPEWAAWCAKYFPLSWDPATGTVVHGSSAAGERVLCK